jgi:hypothetical protein
VPTAIQEEADAHEIPFSEAPGLVVEASAGSGAWTAVHDPPASVRSIPWLLPVVSTYVPSATQDEDEEQEIPFSPASE